MYKLKVTIGSIPGIYHLYRALNRTYNVIRSSFSVFLRYRPAGHFYSPLPSLKEILASRRNTPPTDKDSLGVDLREEEQLALLDELAVYYDELPFSETSSRGNRYHYENLSFSYGDAIVLYAFIRHFAPERMIEIGSGFSSAVMLDTADNFSERPIQMTFIEPYPGKLRSLLQEKDSERCTIIQNFIQDVDPELFEKLNAGDILFVDSSHVVKAGSDVVHILFNIMPRLKEGVIIHFHDIFWAFEYPLDWFMEGIAWNETYFLRAFLQYNSAFEIMYFNSFMVSQHRKAVEEKMPKCLQNPGGSLWLRKIAPA